MQLGAPFDKNGAFAQLGKLNKALFDELNQDPYYALQAPKSLSNQYVQNHFIGLLDASNAKVEDKLYTVVKHIAFKVNEAVKTQTGAQILVTGGGAHNLFLTNAISMETNKEIVIPQRDMIDFKEALIFAFMGVLKKLGEINCLASATGASENSSAGVIYKP
jgi:anhydro-N-acetylmuramic acid kinase